MQIHWRHPKKLTEADREFAMRRLDHLHEGHDDLTDLWIEIAQGSEHHRKGDEKVTIRCLARRASIVATGNDAEVGLALRSALEKFEREVWRMRKRRAEHRPKPAASPPPEAVDGT